MDFAEADRRYEALRQQYQAGALTAEAFDAELRELMVQDAGGRWWAKSRETGKWNYHDAASGAWIEAEPPLADVRRGTVDVLPDAASGQPAHQPPQPTYQAPPVAAPALRPLGSTASMLLYLASLVIPVVGIIAFFMLRNRPFPSDQNAAKVALVLGITSFLITCCWMNQLLNSASSGF